MVSRLSTWLDFLALIQATAPAISESRATIPRIFRPMVFRMEPFRRRVNLQFRSLSQKLRHKTRIQIHKRSKEETMGFSLELPLTEFSAIACSPRFLNCLY